MNKWLQCAMAIMIALSLVFGMASWLNQNAPALINVETQAVGNRPLTPYIVFLQEEFSNDKYIILVDLSDNTSYPHVLTNKIILKSVRAAGCLSAIKTWRYSIGVVTAVTDSATTIEWIWGGCHKKDTQFDERWQLPEHGLSLAVVGGELNRVATLEISSVATITTTTELSTTVGITGVVGVGDLILYTNEISDTATLDVAVTTSYDTE